MPTAGLRYNVNGTIKCKSDRLCSMLKQHCLFLSPRKLNRLSHFCCQNSGSVKNQTSYGVFANHRIIIQVFQRICRSLQGGKAVFSISPASLFNTDTSYLLFLIYRTDFCNSIRGSFPPSARFSTKCSN